MRRLQDGLFAPTAGIAVQSSLLPTLPMFLLMPWIMHRGVSFWLSLVAGCALTIGCFAVTAVVLRRFGIGLLP